MATIGWIVFGLALVWAYWVSGIKISVDNRIDAAAVVICLLGVVYTVGPMDHGWAPFIGFFITTGLLSIPAGMLAASWWVANHFRWARAAPRLLLAAQLFSIIPMLWTILVLGAID